MHFHYKGNLYNLERKNRSVQCCKDNGYFVITWQLSTWKNIRQEPIEFTLELWGLQHQDMLVLHGAKKHPGFKTWTQASLTVLSSHTPHVDKEPSCFSLRHWLHLFLSCTPCPDIHCPMQAHIGNSTTCEVVVHTSSSPCSLTVPYANTLQLWFRNTLFLLITSASKVYQVILTAICCRDRQGKERRPLILGT